MKSGSTVVEVMVGIVILAIIAIAGAAYLGQANSTVAIQRNRMGALATATRYLEELRGTSWGTITNSLPNPRTSATSYVTRTGLCTWSTKSASVLTGYVTNNGVVMTVVTALNYIDVDGGSPSFDCAQATVSVGYPGRQGVSVVLQTVIGVP